MTPPLTVAVPPLVQPDVLYVDLFCGGGGSTTGALRALEDIGLGKIGERVQAIAVNHDDQAIATHTANHPKVDHYNCDIEKLDPDEVLKGREITVLWASAPCQPYSQAANGKGPYTRPQQRATPAYIVDWIRKGRPKVYIEENVWRIIKVWKDWPQHLEDLRSLGYRVEVRKLNAADYGVPQSRERMILIATRGHAPIAWPKQTHSNPKKPVTGTQRWRGAITALDLDIPCPSIFNRGTIKTGKRKGKAKGLSPATRQRIARFIREKGAFWEPLAKAVEEGNGPVPITKLMEVCPVEQWPPWLVPHDDHVHIYAIEPHITKLYSSSRKGQGVEEAAGTVSTGGGKGGGHFGVVQPQFTVIDPALLPVTHQDGSNRTRDTSNVAPAVTGANRGELAVADFIMGTGGMPGQMQPRDAAERESHTVIGNTRLNRGDISLKLGDFTLGQQGGAESRETEEPAAVVPTAGYLRVGELRCMVDGDSSKDTCWLARTKELDVPPGVVRCHARWSLMEVKGILPPRGINGGLHSNPLRDLDREGPSVLAERGAGHFVEARLVDDACLLPNNGERKAAAGMGPDQKPRIHPAEDPAPSVMATRDRGVAFLFVYTYNGKVNCRDIAEPNTTGTTVERHALLEVRLEDLLFDVGMRMLTVRELARLQSFPEEYVFMGNKGDQTRQIGNAVPPDMGYAIVKAVLGMDGVVRKRLDDFGVPPPAPLVAPVPVVQ